MTDPKPDDLYDALRDRLADYGQEPPAPLWGGIRAQLPPPVAAPRLRKRRRASVALLLLLLVAASSLGWLTWHTRKPAAAPLSTATTTDKHSLSAGKRLETDAQRLVSAKQHLETDTQRLALDQQRLVSVRQRLPFKTKRLLSDRQRLVFATESLALDRQRLALSKQRLVSSRQRLLSEPESLALAMKDRKSGAGYSVLGRQSADLPAPGPAAARHRLSGAHWAGAMGRNRPEPGEATATARTTPPTATGPLPADAPAAAPAVTALGRSVSPALGAADAPRQKAAYPPEAAAVAASEAPQTPSARLAKQPGAALALPMLPATQAANVSYAGRPAGTRPAPESAHDAAAAATGFSAEALSRLPARAVALQLMAGRAPASHQPVATPPETPKKSLLARWAVQVLAGPALTYRQLSSPVPANTATSSIGNPVRYQASQATVADLERPALGGGAQASVRRALTERWSLSAGLGYAEYATRLALQQVRATPNMSNVAPRPDSSTTSIHRRDTYRFVTLPVRVGYSRPLAPRWSVGLLAGADVALYIGGSSTEGSPCACQTQTWGASGSPYRRVSLGASLGAEVRYRLNGRWELLAQPTATYLLTPLAQPTTAYYQRHLLGGTALLGASYTLP